MIWYFILALFGASAVLYIIGLVMGIVQYTHNETTIYYDEEQPTEQEVPAQQQLGNSYTEQERMLETML